MTVKTLNRTATFAWGTSADSLPLIATGTVSGALDETFSNVGQLEIWQPEFFGGAGSQGSTDEGLFLGGEGQPGPKGSISTNARFNRLAWSNPSSKHSRGLLASGMETGEVSVWDADKILNGAGASEALVFKNEVHTGPVRGLDFNPKQQNLLASGAINAELQVFDLTNPDKTHSTGPKSTKLDEITSVQWNPSVAHILAASSSSGYTSVWDLRQKREVLSLAYGGGAATGMQGAGRNMGGFGNMQVGNKRGMSSVVWHPNNPTRLITASEDDTSPIVMVWDLRNSLAPEKILSGHDKGILSLSWCAQDSDLLLSCGKDNRTICWNPQSCEIVGELPSSDNWSFQTAWCPRNPDLIATASFDGKIGIHSLQNTHETHNEAGRSANKTNTSNNPDDIFGSQPGEESSSATVLSLKQPPKWLRPPVSVAFGFGGQLASVNGGVVSLQSVVTEQDVIERAKTLAGAIDSQEELGSFCEDMAKKEGGDASAVAGWKALKSLFTTNSRDELVTLLGFSKGEIAHQVSEAIKKFKLTIKTEGEDESEVKTPKEGAVTFAEPGEMEETADGASTPKAESEADGKGISTPSEVSATTDATKKTEAETEMTEHSLFDEDNRIGTPQFDTGAGANFFSSIGQLRNALPDHMQVPHQAYAKDSSVAATIGSRASSVASETMKSNTFKIYPSNESEVDRLITRALVVGDFESAVTLCLSVDRFADALVLAVRGGPDLLAKTQQAYFEKRTTALPYLRLFQSIVSEDLSDVVQNADLTEWQEVFVVLCTFARADEFNGLTEQLGQRIEFQSRMVNGSNDQANSDRAKELRKNALLCYLAAGRLEKAVNIWVEEMREDEDTAVNGAGSDGTKASRYTAHAQALQTFMEKVAVFRSATNYVDRDLAQPTQAVSAAESGARTYSLAALYDRYYEYADLLATQGQTQLAVKYVQQTPAGYKGSKGDEAGPTSVRARYMLGAGLAEQKPAQASTSAFVPTPAQKPPAPSNPAFGIQQPFAPVQEIQQPPLSAAPSAYSPYVPAQPSQPAQTGPSSSTNPYAPSNPYGASNSPYGPGPSTYTPATNNYGQYGGQQPRASAGPVAPPPMARPRQNDSPGPVPAAQRRDIPGWNDAPSMQPKRTGSAPGKPQPIMSPFPEGQSPIVPAQSPMGYQQPNQQPGQFAPPPQRGQGAAIPPPPRGAQPPRPASAQPPPPPPAANQAQYTQAKPMSPPMRAGPPPGAIAGPPPARAMSPLVPPQHRVMSPPAPQQQQYMQPPAPQAQAPSQGSYQPPPGARAGPPPPGRAPSQMGNASSSRPASVAPPTKAAPKYPPGDRSHIPAGSQPIFQSFSDELSRLTHVVPPQQRKNLDDTQRRLNVLFDELNCETVPGPVVAQLNEMVKAIAARDAQAALAMHVDMLTRGPKSEGMTGWMIGIKQLIRLGM